MPRGPQWTESETADLLKAFQQRTRGEISRQRDFWEGVAKLHAELRGTSREAGRSARQCQERHNEVYADMRKFFAIKAKYGHLSGRAEDMSQSDVNEELAQIFRKRTCIAH